MQILEGDDQTLEAEWVFGFPWGNGIPKAQKGNPKKRPPVLDGFGRKCCPSPVGFLWYTKNEGCFGPPFEKLGLKGAEFGGVVRCLNHQMASMDTF